MRGSQPKPNSFPRVAASPYHAFSSETMYLSKFPHQPASIVRSSRCSRRSTVRRAVRRHRQIAGKEVVERRDVGRSLNRRMAAQREDAAAGTADVAEQQLKDRGGANDLNAGRVLRPADGVADGAGPFRSGGAAEGSAIERSIRAERRRRLRPSPACSARSAAKNLEDAARMLQRRVAPRLVAVRAVAGDAARVRPSRRVRIAPVVCRRSHPENKPPRSSVSRKSSLTIVAAFV